MLPFFNQLELATYQNHEDSAICLDCASCCGQRDGSAGRGHKDVKVSVIAYDLGVEQASGLCRQTLIAQREESPTRSEVDRYFIIRRDSSCPELMPEENLQSQRKRTFNLKRDTQCDQDLQELKYFISLSPAGILTKHLRLKPVGGWREIKATTAKKLPCYIMIT